MPRVPVADAQVAPRVSASPEIPGSVLTQGGLDIGGGIERGTANLAQGMRALASIDQRHREENDSFMAEERYVEAMNELNRQTMLDPDGPLNWSGSKSIGMTSGVLKIHEDVGRKALDGLTPGASRAFQAKWLREQGSFQQIASRTEAARRREWQDNVLNRSLESAVAKGMIDPVSNPELIDAGLADGLTALELWGDANMPAPEEFKGRVQDFASGYYAGVILAAEQDDPGSAKLLFDQYGNMLNAGHRLKVEESLKGSVALQQSQRQADEIIGTHTNLATGEVDWKAANASARSLEGELRDDVVTRLGNRMERDASVTRHQKAVREETDWNTLNEILGAPLEVLDEDAAERVLARQTDSGTYSAMKSRLDARIRGSGIVTDPAAYEELQNLFLSATRTGNVDLVDTQNLRLANWSDRISGTDLKKFYTWRTDLLDPAKRQQTIVNAQSSATASNQLVKSMGISEKTDEGRAEAQAVRHSFALMIDDALQRKIAKEGPKARLDQTEIEALRTEFVRGRWDTVGWFGSDQPLPEIVPISEWPTLVEEMRERGIPVTPATMLLWGDFRRAQAGETPRLTEEQSAQMRDALRRSGLSITPTRAPRGE